MKTKPGLNNLTFCLLIYAEKENARAANLISKAAHNPSWLRVRPLLHNWIET